MIKSNLQKAYKMKTLVVIPIHEETWMLILRTFIKKMTNNYTLKSQVNLETKIKLELL